jgi:uncharacterized integral membrane protein
MGNLWLKIKVWTKGITAGLMLLYLLIFVVKNNNEVKFWWWYNRTIESSNLVLMGIAFLAGAISVILIRTTWTTLRQVRDLRTRSRTDRMERELADMKEKAARLQTKPLASSASDVPTSETIE